MQDSALIYIAGFVLLQTGVIAFWGGTMQATLRHLQEKVKPIDNLSDDLIRVESKMAALLERLDGWDHDHKTAPRARKADAA